MLTVPVTNWSDNAGGGGGQVALDTNLCIAGTLSSESVAEGEPLQQRCSNAVCCLDSLGNVWCGWLCAGLSLGFGLLYKNGEDPGNGMCSGLSGSALASQCALAPALFSLSQADVEPSPLLVLLVFLWVGGP